MMAEFASVPKMSADEFLAWEEKQASKHEFLHGEILAMVGVTRQHATVTGNVFTFLRQNLRGTPCRVYMADMKLRVDAADAFFYPDVFVTCSEADHQAERYMTEPRVIVEVLSESTEAYDRGEKFALYRQLPSLIEYLLIHPGKRKTELFRRDASGHWVLFEYRYEEPVRFESLELTLDGTTLFENV